MPDETPAVTEKKSFSKLLFGRATWVWIPLLLVLVLFTTFLLFTGDSATAPFIYTLF